MEVEVLVRSARPVVGVGGRCLRYWSGPPDQWWRVEVTGLVRQTSGKRSRYWFWSRQTSGGGRGTGLVPPDQWWRSRYWSGPPRPGMEVEVLVWSARTSDGGRGTGLVPSDQWWRSRYWSGPPDQWVEVLVWSVRPVVVSEGRC